MADKLTPFLSIKFETSPAAETVLLSIKKTENGQEIVYQLPGNRVAVFTYENDVRTARIMDEVLTC